MKRGAWRNESVRVVGGRRAVRFMVGALRCARNPCPLYQRRSIQRILKGTVRLYERRPTPPRAATLRWRLR